MLVKVRKLSAVDGAKYKTASMEEWIPGGDNYGITPPIDYEVEGEMLREPEPGWSMYVLRHKRNGVEALGEMTTSVVESVEVVSDTLWRVSTRNSVYEVECQ